MPIIRESSYSAPLWLRNGHIQTIWPMFFRNLTLPLIERERLTTPDDDFVDIDHILITPGKRTRRVAILSHGLEGNSRRTYMIGMALALNAAGWDVIARNFRGCSGEPNCRIAMYHSGETNDLDLVVRHCEQLGYTDVALIGFSMGGNQTLKYLGEPQRTIPQSIRAAVGISVPCDLEGSAQVLSRPSRTPYMAYFLKKLRLKMEVKHALFPDRIDIADLPHIRTFKAFDDRYTAPLHGFTSAQHYWRESGCLRCLSNIHVPFLLLNAEDDPFLSPGCYPEPIAQQNTCMTLEIPRWGGHLGFVSPGKGLYWSEKRTVEYLACCIDTF